MDQPPRGNSPQFHALCEQQCARIVAQIGEASALVESLRRIFSRVRGMNP